MTARTLILLVTLVVPRLAHATPDMPEQVPVVDVSAIADKLVVLDDGQGNLIAFRRDEPRETVYFGTKEHLYQLQIVSSSADGDTSFDVSSLDFRAPDRRSTFGLRDGAYAMECAGVTRALRPLPAAEARVIAKGAVFHDYRWRRNAVALYRDEYGVYYYIDRATGDDRDADHRVYIGFRGQILRAPLKLMASDSLGRVYAAANGARRLVITGDEVRYVEDTTERRLYPLDLVMDGPFIYGPLGVYGDVPHGTPCDVLLPKP